MKIINENNTFGKAFDIMRENHETLYIRRSTLKDNETLNLKYCENFNDFRIFKNIDMITFLWYPSQIDILSKDWEIIEME